MTVGKRTLNLAIDALAAYRLTKLVVDDQLTAEPRDAIVRAAYESAGRREAMEAEHSPQHPGDWVDVIAEDPDPPKLAILVSCPWCAGMWISLGVVALRHAVPSAWRPIARALALSAAAGLIAENLQHS